MSANPNTGTEPLRILLTGSPQEIINGQVPPGTANRAFLVEQALRLIEANEGAGAQYLSAEEYERIKRVWIENKRANPITHISKPAWAEIEREHAIIEERDARIEP